MQKHGKKLAALYSAATLSIIAIGLLKGVNGSQLGLVGLVVIFWLHLRGALIGKTIMWGMYVVKKTPDNEREVVGNIVAHTVLWGFCGFLLASGAYA